MGVYDPQIGVGTSGTRPALGRNYATNAATAGRVLTSQGDNLPPTWTAPAPGVVPVAQTLFVDAVNFGAVPTGTLAAPFQTIQQAINQAVVNGWLAVQIIVAPATYADPVAIPIALQTVVIGTWNSLGAILGGDITIASLAAGWADLTLRGVMVTAATITTDNPAVQDLSLALIDVDCAATITAFNLTLMQRTTMQSGAVTVGGGLVATFDGWSWARHLQMSPVFTVGAIYTRNLWDAGHGTFATTVTVNGVAVGATAFVALPVPAYVRADDRVAVQVADPAVQDFLVGVHGVNAASVVVWLTNLSRVSTNFADDVLLLVHHETMIADT